MVEPITLAAVVAGGAAVGGIASFLNSERGRSLASKERKKIEKIVSKLQAPQLETGMLTPPELQVLQKYVPEVAQFIEEKAPNLISVSERGRLGQKAQEESLARLRAIAAGEDRLGNLEVIAALNEAAQRGGAQRDAILMDMMRQGVAPSSSAFGTLQYGVASQTQKNLFISALQAALADRRRRDEATRSAADLGGSIASNEISLERYNDEVINALNRRNTEARRAWLQNRADEMNRAQAYNIKEAQRLYEQNAANLYSAGLAARDLRNKQKMAEYETEVAKINALAGVSAGKVSDIYQTAQDRNQLISGLSDAATTAALIYGIGGKAPAATPQAPQPPPTQPLPTQPQYGLGVDYRAVTSGLRNPYEISYGGY